MKLSGIKILKVAATVLGIGASLLASYVADKLLDTKIAEQVAKTVPSK